MPAADPVAGPVGDAVRRRVVDLEGELVALRRALHAWPELAGAEVRTTDAVRDRLGGAGLAPRALPLPTGLVCDVGTGVPTVALRADLDALAMVDGTDAPYRSRIDGVAHACGHDVHTAVLVGAAVALHELLPPGTGVRCIFEPAEETVPGGAYDIAAAGLVDGLDAVVGLHCEPKLDVGVIGLRTGPITSAADLVEITVRGPGGHTARPELTVDLVRALATVAVELPGLVRRRHPALHLVFGAILAGDAANVVPASGVVRGTVRTGDRDAWALVPEALAAGLEQLLDAGGATWVVDHRRGGPPVVNDAAVTQTVRAAAIDGVGAGCVVEVGTSMGGDSFAWYTERIPGTYVRLGVHTPGTPLLDLHAGTFDVDERSIAVGVELLVRSALSLVRSGAG